MALNTVDGLFTPPDKRPSKTKKGLGSAPKSSSSRRRSNPTPPRPVPSQPSFSGPVQSVTPPRPKPPSIKDYLAGDEVYQQSLRGGQRTLNDFLSEINRRKGEAETSFGQTQDSMERDRTRQLDQMKDEFASRGLIHSGLYGKEQGRFQEDFMQQMQQLDQQQKSLIADLLAQRTSAKREQDLAMEAAKQEALARRASRHNIT